METSPAEWATNTEQSPHTFIFSNRQKHRKMSKNFIAVCLLLFSAFSVRAQPFVADTVYRLPLMDSLRAQWGDMNGDGKLDIVVFGKKDGKTGTFLLIQEDSVTYIRHSLQLDATASMNFQLKDFDHSGTLDIIYTNRSEPPQLVIALNRTDLVFEKLPLEIEVDEFLIYDIDEDGDQDFIAGVSDGLDAPAIVRIKNDTAFVATDTLHEAKLLDGQFFIEEQGIHALTEDGASRNGFSRIYLKKDTLVMDSVAYLPSIASGAYGDLNHNGTVDFVFQSNEQILIAYDHDDQIEPDTLENVGEAAAVLFVGDFDLDGLADIVAHYSNETLPQTVFYKNMGEGEYASDSVFFVDNGIALIPADVNDDGDLDLLTVQQDSDSMTLVVQFNQTEIKNTGPLSVAIDRPTTIGEKTYFSWRRSSDDHANPPAISYEIFIEKDGVYHTMPATNLDPGIRWGFRGIVAHGYRWFDTNYTAFNLGNGRYRWGVAGVDNAYYSSTNICECTGGGGTCVDFYTVFNCFDVLTEDTTVCYNATVTIDLQRGDDAISWYSVKQGFLEDSPVLHFTAREDDVIYAVHEPRIPCGQNTDLCVLNYSLSIEVEAREEMLLQESTICPGMEHRIAVEGTWDSVRWWLGDVIVARGPEIFLDSIPNPQLIAEAFDAPGCTIYDTLEVRAVERAFNPDLVSKSISACEGEATEVTVFEGIDIENLGFDWLPEEMFDDPNSAFPKITATIDGQVSAVVVENECYVDTLIFDVEVFALPVVTTNGDQELFRSQEVLLEANGAISYEWRPDGGLRSPNRAQTWASPDQTTTYTVRGTNEHNCYVDEQLTVLVKGSVYIPDLFSPNGDGKNDFLQVYGEGISSISFKVFDERGSLIIELDETSFGKGWDGTASGNELPSGTYFWTVKGSFLDGQSITYLGKNRGTVRLVR
jgi:gliding motility-associated-like protein